MNKKALIAMSGGVDSSVTAYLMKEMGYDCIGVTMNLHHDDENTRDILDAREICKKLDIPFYVLNLKKEFQEFVVKPFIDSYLLGYTPNPCIECNRYLKFDYLIKYAKELNCDTIATGHYAKVIEDEEGFHLYKGKDPKKDQSYVLYNIKAENLPHIVFPLGGYSKQEIREIAESKGFITAHKSDSQDICFIPDGDYRKFLESEGIKGESGDFVSLDGKLLGKNKGYFSYTIGQRKGLGVSGPYPYYVTDIIPEENKVVLGKNDDLFHYGLTANNFNFIEDVKSGDSILARVRYHHIEEEAKIYIKEDNTVEIIFDNAQRAITKGQSVVIYKGEKVLGGGIITGVLK